MVKRERSSPAERLLRYNELKTTYELIPETSKEMRTTSVKVMFLYLGGNETVHSSFLGRVFLFIQMSPEHIVQDFKFS